MALLYSAVMRPSPSLFLLILVLAGLVGCVTVNRPESCDANEATVEVTVSATALDPRDPAACRGQLVSIVIRSEVDGVFHLHGLDPVVPATTITADEQVTLQFTADRSGQFPVELHPADDPEGVTIGIFTVHER